MAHFQHTNRLNNWVSDYSGSRLFNLPVTISLSDILVRFFYQVFDPVRQ